MHAQKGRPLRRSAATLIALCPLSILLAMPAAHIARAWQADSAGAALNPSFSAERFLTPIKFLAGDPLKGRGNGTPELDQAAQYIADHFRADGLKPGGDKGTYLQHFQVTVGAKLGANNSFAVQQGGSSATLALGEDYTPLSFSHDGHFEGPVVFAGYGITAPEYHYDDYKGLDVKGKMVLVLRHEPQENDDKSVFAGKQLTTHSEIVNKAINARNHGAAGMILVNDTANHPGEPDQLIKFGELAGPEDLAIPALQVKAAVADKWLKPGGQTPGGETPSSQTPNSQTLDQLSQAIDKDLSNHSFALDPNLKVALTVDVERIRRTEGNVVGILPGSDPGLAAQCIVIGAHYDHLGLGDQHSLAPSQIGQIHHGADDNASGTSAVLEIADYFAHREPRPRHSIVFVTFAGEELGLLGSSYYAEHPAMPMASTVAMINMDMVGRISGNRLYVGGTGTSPGFQKLVETANQSDPAAHFELSYSASGYGASDHTSFTVRSVPVLFFFSGLHSDYHKPSDTWEKINSVDGARVAELVADSANSIDQLDTKPEYVRVAEPASPAMGGGGGYGPYFGSIPDFGQEHGGVKFGDVRDGSPAAKAGFKAGDVLVQFGDAKIDNLYDFTYALRAHKPGDKVMVTVLRGGERVTREVTLEVRK
ncbi:MAG TPA: M28 family peptidase [Terriglobia bacterium]|nr:M28 family peptidase [Terriglobia bacterium]